MNFEYHYQTKHFRNYVDPYSTAIRRSILIVWNCFFYDKYPSEFVSLAVDIKKAIDKAIFLVAYNIAKL